MSVSNLNDRSKLSYRLCLQKLVVLSLLLIMYQDSFSPILRYLRTLQKCCLNSALAVAGSQRGTMPFEEGLKAMLRTLLRNE